jgi:hypothetical protein
MIETTELEAVVSVLPIWKTHDAFGRKRAETSRDICLALNFRDEFRVSRPRWRT